MEISLIEAALKQGDISSELFQGSANKGLVTELQKVLFELGFKRELQFDNFQATGNYGSATVSALAAFATKNKFKNDDYC